jgi:hypothetical protein
MIESMGFEQWLELERKLLPEEYRNSEKYRQKVAGLAEWARENGYDKPKLERLGRE